MILMEHIVSNKGLSVIMVGNVVSINEQSSSKKCKSLSWEWQGIIIQYLYNSLKTYSRHIHKPLLSEIKAMTFKNKTIICLYVDQKDSYERLQVLPEIISGLMRS